MNKKQTKILESNVVEMLNLINLHRGDNEALHCEADDILIKCLNELGCETLVDAYWEVFNSCRGGFWYA